MLTEASIPIEVKRITEGAFGAGIKLTWSTGEQVTISSKTLRLRCPCASCNDKRGDQTHQKPLGGVRTSLRVLKNTLEEEIDLVKIWGVGSYAIGMRWGDQHDSGIYTYALLRELSQEAAKKETPVD